ncbi:MAG TPA: glutamyl-tRNA reductase [Gemmatimonadales bacterium]|nr:glutamyl-tRNA reductase [Gemmatimonadales bacterium]
MPTALQLQLAGISHHTADVGLRERLSLEPEAIAAWLARERDAGRPSVVLATCNRVELYWWGDAEERRLHVLAAERGVALPPPASYELSGTQTVRHLFRVAAGLDSQVFGEREILGQVRRAHELARAAGATNWQIDAAFCAALTAGRRTRHETTLGLHPASVSSAALSHARLCWGGSLAGRAVLVLGAGEAAEGVLRALEDEPGGSAIVVNHHDDRASALAATSDVAASAHWDELPAALADADVVVTATASPHPVLSAAALEAAVAARAGRPIVVLDLAVPRNVESLARDVPGVRLFDLDDLRMQHCPVTASTSPALDAAEEILRQELVQFRRLLRNRAAAPHLAELHRLGARLAAEEAERALAELPSLTEREQEVLRRMTSRLVRRLLYPASKAIREREG